VVSILLRRSYILVATYLEVSFPHVLAVKARLPDLSLGHAGPVAAVEAHCRPAAEHVGSGDSGAVPGSAAMIVGNMDHCMSHLGSIVAVVAVVVVVVVVAAGVGDSDLTGLVCSWRSCLGSRRIAVCFPNPLAAHSGHYPIAPAPAGHGHNHNIVGHSDRRSPDTAVADLVAQRPGTAVAGARSCWVGVDTPYRRLDRGTRGSGAGALSIKRLVNDC